MANHLIHRGFVGAYVYAITVDGVVRYIGKGRRYRAIEHFRVARDLNERRAKGEKVKALPFHNKLAKAVRLGAAIDYEIIINGLEDDVAYEREIIEIAKYPAGQLWNVHRGGSGGDADMMRRMWQDQDFRDRVTAASRKGRKRPEVIERARQTAQSYWDDPEWRAEQIERERAGWADPEYRAKRVAILQKVWADPEKSARKGALVKTQWTPERKAAQAAQRKAAWADPEFSKRVRAKIAATRSSADYSERMRKIATERWADPEFRAKTVAAIRASVVKRDDKSQTSLPFYSARTQKI